MADAVEHLTVTSPDIEDGGAIAKAFTMYGENRVPRIRISGVPGDAVEVALICHDPDAPSAEGYTHWVLYGLPPRDVEVGSDADSRYRPGRNSAGTRAWYGPRPPAGHGPHHYRFSAYALDAPVAGTPDREEFLARYGAHVIAQSTLVGVYER